MGHLDEQDILRLTSVLKRVKEIAKNDKNLTQDIDDALNILSVNTKDNIIIPNVSHRRKVYNRYQLEETTKQNMMQEQAKTKYPDSSSLVSFAVNLHSHSEHESQTILRKIVSTVPQFNYSIVIAAQYKSVTSAVNNRLMELVQTDTQWTEGYVWNKLVQQVKTPFILIARDIAMYTGQENITRLLEVIPSLGSPVLGGATRTIEEGHWDLNCFQMLHHNYSIFHQSGYHKSEKSCLYCDYFWGPFLAEKQFLVSHPFSETLTQQLVFHDFFFKLNAQHKYTSVVCPDVMFEISEVSKQFPTKAGWLPLATEHFVNRIKHPDGSSVSYSCDELGQTIHKHEVGKMKSPCDLEILSDWVKHFHKLCKELGGISFIMEGGVFGKMTLSFLCFSFCRINLAHLPGERLTCGFISFMDVLLGNSPLHDRLSLFWCIHSD